MKTLEVIEHEARLEWLATICLREEFPELDAYLAFRRAEAKGRFNYASDINPASFVTNPHP